MKQFLLILLKTFLTSLVMIPILLKVVGVVPEWFEYISGICYLIALVIVALSVERYIKKIFND